MTANYNNYSAVELEKALQSWVEPYPKPIIMNHDLNTEPIGRVMAAKMDKEEDGSSFVRLQIAITDPVAAQKILDKRYLTGSVGGRAGKAVCSISGDDLAKEDASGRPRMPKYRRGSVHKGKLAFIDMQDISFKEYSFVNQPADQRSGVRSKAKSENGAPVADSDWVAKSSAFVLSMNEEDVYSIEESRSIFSGMKKKESRPVYLHLKGAFLSAMAIHESEDYNIENASLLSSENDLKNNKENTEMTVSTEQEDILAVSEELSEDLSSIASGTAKDVNDQSESNPEDETPAEEAPAEEAPAEDSEESEKAEDVTTDKSEESDVQEEKAESEKSDESVETPEETQDQGAKEETSELNDTKSEEATEQKDEDLLAKIKLLEDENKKLKAALHKVLAERVVDAKISAGLESVSNREELVKVHCERTASSLADSLRDMARVPARKSASVEIPEITSEAEVAHEEGHVASMDA